MHQMSTLDSILTNWISYSTDINACTSEHCKPHSPVTEMVNYMLHAHASHINTSEDYL
jgi:hypothetical protein